MKKENKEKISSAFFLFASICFYLATVLCFISEKADNSRVIINLCLGSTFLCLSFVCKKEEKEKTKSDNK